MLRAVRTTREQVLGTEFQGEVRPIEDHDHAYWTNLLGQAHFSAWALESLPLMTHRLVMRCGKSCELRAILPSEALPGALEAGLVRVLSLRRWLDGDRPQAVVIEHAHMPGNREADPSETLEAEHVNGGMTSAMCGMSIVCYRAEECPKVWTHEYLHHRCVDQTLRSIHHGPGLLSEAFVETWATLWNCMHTVLEQKSTATLQDAIPLLEQERDFVLQQAARAVYHQGVRNWDQLDLKNWTETTNVWSYYVVRAAWLFEPNAFLKTTPSPAHGTSSGPTLQWLAETTMQSPAWRMEMDQRLRDLRPGTPWTLRMTRTDSPLVQKSTSFRKHSLSEGSH